MHPFLLFAAVIQFSTNLNSITFDYAPMIALIKGFLLMDKTIHLFVSKITFKNYSNFEGSRVIFNSSTVLSDTYITCWIIPC